MYEEVKEEIIRAIEQAARDVGEWLDLSHKDLTALPAEIGWLSRLTALNLEENRLTDLPPEIGRLQNLRELNLSDNQLTTLPAEIAQLSKLTKLYVRGNRLTELPPELANLQNLAELNLESNQLTSLPLDLSRLSSLAELHLEGNPLPIPPEILELTNRPSEILAYYRQSQVTSLSRPLNEAKLLLVGQGGVGKTSLVKSLIGDGYDPSESVTSGINITRWELDTPDDRIRLNVWDFGGQEIFYATPPILFHQEKPIPLSLGCQAGRARERY